MKLFAQRIAEALDNDGSLANLVEYHGGRPVHIDPKPHVVPIIDAEIAPLLAVVSAAKEYLQASNLTERTERWRKLAKAVSELSEETEADNDR